MNVKKMTKYGHRVKVPALIFLLILAGFSRSWGDGGAIDGRLAGSWSNNREKRDAKTLFIDVAGLSFTASLDPGMGRGTVSGKIGIKDGEYVLLDMAETTGRFWGFAVKSFNDTPVQILFHDDDSFNLSCEKSKMVETFFGGDFYRQ
jgi:hypothetical protein